MGAEFKYKNPLTIQLGTGVTGSVNGENFTSREIQGLVDENVTINIGQEVETTSNTTFNNVTSSNVLKAGNLFLGDGFISSSNSVVAHTGSDVPFVLQYPRGETEWEVKLAENFDEKHVKMKVNLKEKSLKFYRDGKELR